MSEHLILNDFRRSVIDDVLPQLEGVPCENLKDYKDWEVFAFTNFYLSFDAVAKCLKLDFVKGHICTSENGKTIVCTSDIFVKKVKNQLNLQKK